MTALGNAIQMIQTKYMTQSLCPFDSSSGSSSVGLFMNSMPKIISVPSGCCGGGSIWGGCCGGISPYENGYSYNIKAMSDVSWGETAGAAGKELLFDAIKSLGTNGGAANNLLGNGTALLSGVTGLASGLLGIGGKAAGGLLGGIGDLASGAFSWIGSLFGGGSSGSSQVSDLSSLGNTALNLDSFGIC